MNNTLKVESSKSPLKIENLNLVIIGMPKCGSYYLYELLNQHPDICMHEFKEPNYFMDHLSQAEYLSGFKTHGAKYYGEASVGILGNEKALSRLAQEAPNVKILVLYRDPVKRAVSHFFHRRNGGVDERSMNELLEYTNGSSCYPVYFSKYQFHTERLLKYFSEDRFRIIISEDLFSKTSDVLSGIFKFLELPEISFESEKAYRNEGKLYKAKFLRHLILKIKKSSYLKSVILFLFPGLSGSRKKLDKMFQSRKDQKSLIKDEQMAFLENELGKERDFVREYLNDKSIWAQSEKTRID